jgi:glycosyltransferase involved in cell wall biosynthesis
MRTLRQAVDSVYTQKFTDPFEIVIVDDGSTDGTKALIEDIAKERLEILYIVNPKNRGGGAARNIGIKQSRGKYIYCLDSDNILGPAMLPRMMEYAEKNQYDAVTFEERRFFSANIKRYYVKRNAILDRGLALADVFNTDVSIMIDNFLYTRKSYEKTAGYPEHHGFDTQSFEMRFLLANGCIGVCPKTFSYHRYAHRTASYFEREYVKGNLSRNYYLMIEDMLPALSDETIEKIIDFDIFSRTQLDDNIFLLLSALGRKNTLFKNKESAPGKDGSKMVTHFRQAVEKFRNKDFSSALDELAEMAKTKPPTQVMHYNIVRNYIGLLSPDFVAIEKKCDNIFMISGHRPKTLRIYRWYHRLPITNMILPHYLKLKKIIRNTP